MHRRSAAETAWIVVDTTTGVAVVFARAGRWIGVAVARTLLPLRDLLARPPLVPARYQPAHLISGLAADGHDRRDAAIRAVRHLVQRSVPVATAEILDQLDLTELIRERVDLIGLTRYVAAGLRLPESIRESTGSLTSEAVRHAQIHGAEADQAEGDQAVAEWVDRVFRPRRAGDDDPDEPAEPG